MCLYKRYSKLILMFCLPVATMSHAFATAGLPLQTGNSCNIQRLGTAVYQVGRSLRIVTTGDLNGDGHLDLVGIDDSNVNGVVAIVNGDGKGAFTPGATFTTASSVSDLAVIDFNNDGKLDIALTLSNRPMVQIYLNNGQSGFNAPQQIELPQVEPFPTVAFGLFTGDFNSDQKTDLLVSFNSRGDTAIINNGNTGGYNINVRLEIKYGLGDFNGDGKKDLLGAQDRGPGARLSILPGDGRGGFGAARSFPTAGQISSPATIADFNGDGNLDVAIGTTAIVMVIGQVGSAVAILPGDGAGGLGAQTNFTIEGLPAGQVRGIIAADFNGDAKIDAAFTYNRRLYVMLNDGTGKLNAPWISEEGVFGGLQGDFNEDSKTDFVTGTGNNSVTVTLNRCGVPGLIISGRAIDNNTISGVSGVTMMLTGAASATAQTDIGGNYQFANLPSGGPYTVMAQRAGYLFDQTSRTIPNLTMDQTLNFGSVKQATNVSAASYSGQALAPDSIVAAFGTELARSTMQSPGLPLPTFLNDTRVDIKDSLGATRPAPLFYISPTQVNYLMPPQTAIGTATVKLGIFSGGDRSISEQSSEIASVAPGLFTANANGQGVAAAVVLRMKIDGSQTYEPVAIFDQTQNKFIARQIDLGPPTCRWKIKLFPQMATSSLSRHGVGLARANEVIS